ncbi:MAG: dUTP diphosphatase [Gammaproteobacteria bacterium]|nr:dUTP diphosphatase [Gammaproteobacteria bacterium]MCP5136478.1 dUTP diphosphatase [Gammaproteobacteria bacterium]
MTSVVIPITVVTDIPHFPIPERKTLGSAGADLQAAIREPLTIGPGESALVKAGIAIALPEGYEAQVRPRSGLALKHQITVLNSPGTIDSDYRGEVGVILINHGKTAFTVEPLMRIAQMVITQVPNTMWVLSEELDDTERGAGGFGHTGT